MRALDYYTEIEKYTPKPRQYIDGETVRILGHDLRLKVVQGKENVVECDQSYVTLTVKETNNLNLKKECWISGQGNVVKKPYSNYAKLSILSFKNMG